jgi:DNA-binding NtrC family response regulator
MVSYIETPPQSSASRFSEPSLETVTAPSQIVTVLSVSPFADDHLDLQSIFSHSNWRLSRAANCDEAVASVRRSHIPVIISEKELAGSCWRTMLRRIHQLELRPGPRLIVSARLADDQLWSEVLNLGGYNVLEKPFDQREVCWVVSHAWLDWKSERDRTSHRRSAIGGVAGH